MVEIYVSDDQKWCTTKVSDIRLSGGCQYIGIPPVSRVSLVPCLIISCTMFYFLKEYSRNTCFIWKVGFLGDVVNTLSGVIQWNFTAWFSDDTKNKAAQRHLMRKINYLTISLANIMRFYEISGLILDVRIENNRQEDKVDHWLVWPLGRW